VSLVPAVPPHVLTLRWQRTLATELEALAELTAVHGPWGAAVLLNGAPPVVDASQRVAVPGPLVPRSYAGQRALIAARARKRARRSMYALSRRWAG
jgi:hypothetical protein